MQLTDLTGLLYTQQPMFSFGEIVWARRSQATWTNYASGSAPTHLACYLNLRKLCACRTYRIRTFQYRWTSLSCMILTVCNVYSANPESRFLLLVRTFPRANSLRLLSNFSPAGHVTESLEGFVYEIAEEAGLSLDDGCVRVSLSFSSLPIQRFYDVLDLIRNMTVAPFTRLVEIRGIICTISSPVPVVYDWITL